MFGQTELTAVPNYRDEIQTMPNGETRHIVGWELVFAPTVVLVAGNVLEWRNKRWRVNLIRKLLTQVRATVTEIPS